VLFNNGYGNLTIQEFSFKWVKVMLPYKVGGLPIGGGGSLMSHTHAYSLSARIPYLLKEQ